MVRKGKLFLSLVVVMAGLIAAISLQVNNVLKEEKIITLTVAEGERSLLHLPLYMALQLGYFEEQGVRVRLTGGNGAGQYGGGIPDADVVLLDPAAYLYHNALQSEGPVILTAVAGREGTFLLAREKEDFTWSGLRGKKIISYPPETGPGLALDKKLRANGLTPFHDIGIYHRIPPDLRLGAFKAGSGDYIQLSGIQALTAEQDGTGFIAAAVGDGDEAFPAVICAVSRATINKHPEAVQMFINGLYKAQLYISREPEMALPAVRSLASKKERRKMEALFDRYAAMDMWQPRPELDEAAFAALTQAMEAAGQLPAPVQFSSAVSNDFARLAAEAVQYIPPEERNKNWLQKLLAVIIKHL